MVRGSGTPSTLPIVKEYMERKGEVTQYGVYKYLKKIYERNNWEPKSYHSVRVMFSQLKKKNLIKKTRMEKSEGTKFSKVYYKLVEKNKDHPS